MIFNLKPPKDYIHYTQWHDWFAWHPVIVEYCGTGYSLNMLATRKLVWLRTVERKVEYFAVDWMWFYRLKGSNE